MAGGLLTAAASLIGPEPSSASSVQLGAGTRRVAGDPFANAVKLPAYLGSLTSRGYKVEVFIGRVGPLYTVSDLSGSVLATHLNADALYARFPELDVSTLHAEGDSRETSAD